MKTQTKIKVIAILCLQASLAMIGCGKSDSGSSAGGAAAPIYTNNNGVCTGNGQVVAFSNCSNNGAYTTNSTGSCVATANPSVAVNPAFCQQNYGTNGINGSSLYGNSYGQTITGSCAGQVMRDLYGHVGYCTPGLCAGFQMYPAQTSQYTSYQGSGAIFCTN